MSTLELFSQELGMNLYLFLLIIIWTLTWKLIALWKAARNNHLVWFLVMAIVNTIGILPILYIFLFQNLSKKENQIEKVKEVKKSKRKTSKPKKKK